MAAQAHGGGPAQGLRSDVQGVITSVNNIDDVGTEIKALSRQLEAEAEAVIKGSWTGAAADKVHQGWQEWKDGLDKISAALDQVNGLVANAAQRFQQADQEGR